MELRWYQRESCNATWHHLARGCEAGNPAIVLPTGAGKSLVIAELCRAAVEQYQGQVIVLAHRKELLAQNAEKIQTLIPQIKIDLYSAGLRRWGTEAPVVVAGIQSCFKKAADFGRRHLVLIDECHLIPDSDDGMYRTFLTQLAAINPKLKMVGLTATPFRTGDGSICGEGKMFRNVCYSAPLQKLIGEGFLSEITSKSADASVDTSNLHIRGGEFIGNEAEQLFDTKDNVQAACKEIVTRTQGRNSIMVFCSGVMHAGDVADAIEEMTGEQVGVITGESSNIERGTFIENFKSRRLRWLVNVDVLTTGFDAPCVDAIAVLRATMSPGLFAQICGRGLRTYQGKTNCLILDFGENIKRHGALDDPMYGLKQKKKIEIEVDENREPQPNEKRCPGCDEIVSANLRLCECGYKFPARHEANASSDDVLSKPITWKILDVKLSRHRKKTSVEGTPDTLRVDYTCIKKDDIGNLNEETISEWVCLEHGQGFAFTKARVWWLAHSNAELPSGIDEAIDLFNRGAVGMPEEITTIKEGGFYRIQKTSGIIKPAVWQEPRESGDILGWDEWGEPIYEELVEPSETQDEELPF